MVGQNVLMFQGCTTYNKKDKSTNKPTGVKGYILNMLEISKNEEGDMIINNVTFFPDVWNRTDLKPFDLVSCKLEYLLNRKPALLEIGEKVTTNNTLTIMLP